MVENNGYKRHLTVQTEDFSFSGEIDISSEIDNPEEMTDKLEEHISDALVEFVVEQSE